MPSESPALRAAVFEALAVCLDLSPASAAASALIHRAYAEPENGPRPPRDRDVIYYDLQRETAEEDWYLSSPDAVTYFSVNRASSAVIPISLPQTVRAVLAYQLVVVCYGPNAEENALRIRTWLYLDGAGKPLSILRGAGAWPVPDPPQPLIVHEPEGSLWRRRADLTVSLRVLDERTRSVGNLRSAPKVIIWR